MKKLILIGIIGILALSGCAGPQTKTDKGTAYGAAGGAVAGAILGQAIGRDTQGTLIGAGTVVIPGISIGKWATIGAGSVITKDVPDNAVVVGNPSRVVRVDE